MHRHPSANHLLIFRLANFVALRHGCRYHPGRPARPAVDDACRFSRPVNRLKARFIRIPAGGPKRRLGDWQGTLALLARNLRGRVPDETRYVVEREC